MIYVGVVAESQDASLRGFLGQQIFGPQYSSVRPRCLSTPPQAMHKHDAGLMSAGASFGRSKQAVALRSRQIKADPWSRWTAF